MSVKVVCMKQADMYRQAPSTCEGLQTYGAFTLRVPVCIAMWRLKLLVETIPRTQMLHR